MFIVAPMLVSGVPSARATDWPAKPVTVVVGYAAGGNTDVMARMASKKLSEDLKQSFVVENRIGAGGALAAAYVAQAAPDGYTLFFAAAPQIAIVPQLQKVNYDPSKDFVPVSVFGTGPFILGINSSIPARTIAEFVAYAKTRKINYGSSGVGSVAHLAGALFVNRAGLDAVHVPFRGSGQVTAALLGGQIDMFFGNASDLVPQFESGKVTLLGVATPQRMKQLPNVPTIGETYPSTSLEKVGTASWRRPRPLQRSSTSLPSTSSRRRATPQPRRSWRRSVSRRTAPRRKNSWPRSAGSSRSSTTPSRPPSCSRNKRWSQLPGMTPFGSEKQ
jgi:tripartite-type tricarboxylate transporter receptor subunit TctC